MTAVASAQKNREMFAIKKSYSIENGYPSRRRSLVDDARFETLVVKQTKQNVLDDARLRANDSGVDVDLDYETMSNESGSSSSNNSSSEILTSTTTASDASENGTVADDDANLTEEELFLSNAVGESPEGGQILQKACLILRLRDSMNSLARILKSTEKYQANVLHLETRPNATNVVDENGKQSLSSSSLNLDALVEVQMSRTNLLTFIKSLRQSQCLENVVLLSDENITSKTPWFPRHAIDLDNCNHLMTKYEPDLDMEHPGFSDMEYRARRKQIAEIAFAYKYGDPIPHIEYNDDETKTWGSVFKTVDELVWKHACKEYRNVFKLLKEEEIFSDKRVPQLDEVSNFLRKHTGFSLRPAAGLLTARDFLASLAFRVFQSTQYVRHKNTPYHTPEPDCIHELLGHMPMLADPGFAQFSQEIGLASLGASDAEIEKLSTVYWFTVEFGLCKEQGAVKAYGAALLSAYGELVHALSDKPELRPFEPAVTAVQPYQDQEYQPIYYVAESFDDMKDKFRRWVASMSRPFEVRFNPHTGRVEVLDTVGKLESLIQQLNTELLHLGNAVDKMRLPNPFRSH